MRFTFKIIYLIDLTIEISILCFKRRKEYLAKFGVGQYVQWSRVNKFKCLNINGVSAIIHFEKNSRKKSVLW